MSGATSYKVYRGTATGVYGGTPVASGVTATTYTNTALTNGTTYHYAVVATNAQGDSGYSPDAAVTPVAPAPPAAPTGVVATQGAVNSKAITVTWNASTGATSYTVKRSTTISGAYTTMATGLTTRSYTNTNLTKGIRYYYVVVAVSAAGSSPNSAQVSAVAR